MTERQSEMKIPEFAIYSTVMAVVVVALVLAYVSHFGATQISFNTQDWGAFSTYIGELLSPIVSFFAFVFAYRAYRLQESEIRGARASQESQINIAALSALLRSKTHEIQIHRQKISDIQRQVAEHQQDQSRKIILEKNENVSVQDALEAQDKITNRISVLAKERLFIEAALTEYLSVAVRELVSDPERRQFFDDWKNIRPEV